VRERKEKGTPVRGYRYKGALAGAL
jgi:hypothetical protein